MKTNRLYLFAVVGFLLFASSKVLACSCLPPKYGETLETKVGKARNDSKAVFTGTVLNITEDKENRTRTVRLRLLKSWKGDFSKEVTIVTGWDDGDCGYRFTVGGTYLVYAFKSG